MISFSGRRDAPIIRGISACIRSVAGSINPGPDSITLASVYLDVANWTVRFEADAKDAAGKPVHIAAEGKLEDISSYHRKITGSWMQGTTRGDFRLAYVAATLFVVITSVLRMAFGGHFFTDVAAAGLVTFLVIWLAHGYIYRWRRTRLTDESIDAALTRFAWPGYRRVQQWRGRDVGAIPTV